jgi:hypothetical protein
MMRLVISVFVLAFASMACSATPGNDASEQPSGSASGSAAPSDPTASDPMASGLRPVTPAPGSPGAGSPGTGSGSLSAAIIDPIVADAAGNAGVPVSEVSIVSAKAVTWPDAGLGCPLPGMVYPQVLVDGYQVIVQVGQQTIDYRGSSAGKFRVCTNPV